MNKKGSLFFLIKSLSKSEKRYFRLYAGTSESNYLRLFDFIEKQKEPDDAAIKKQFRQEKFTRQLHVAKIYLSDLISESLRSYHRGHSSFSEVLDLLRDIEILHAKELYDLALQKLAKAEQLALRYERLALLLEVLSWKRKLMLATVEGAKQALSPIWEREKQVQYQLQELNYFWEQTYAVFENYKQKDYLEQLRHRKANTLQSNILLLHLKYSCYFMNGELQKAEAVVNELIAMIERTPERITDEPSAYLAAIGNKIGLLIGQKRWEETELLIKKMRKAPELYKLNPESKFTLRLWLRIFNLELELCRDTGQLVKGLSVIRELEAFLSSKDAAVPDYYRIMLYFQAASIFFMKKDLSDALKWMNSLLNYNFGDKRPDLQCYARLLNLLIHFELGNIIVLRYSLDSARRFFKKKKFTGAFQQGALKLFSQLSLASADKYPFIFKSCYDDLFGPKSGDYRSELDYLDLKTWLGSKLQPRRSKAR